MFKWKTKYEDYNGVEREEELYFNLTKAEIMEMEMSQSGGFTGYIQKAIQAQDAPTLIKLFKDLILKSYGEKSLDGKHFVKIDPAGNPLSIAFSQTEAYSQLFMELATDADKASKFINGIVPADIAQQAQANPIPPQIK